MRYCPICGNDDFAIVPRFDKQNSQHHYFTDCCLAEIPPNDPDVTRMFGKNSK
jgi:hypothetical protein